MANALDGLIESAGLNQEQIGSALGFAASTISNKLAGRRRWTQEEVSALLTLLSVRLKRKVTFEEAFGPSSPDPTNPAPDVPTEQDAFATLSASYNGAPSQED